MPKPKLLSRLTIRTVLLAALGFMVLLSTTNLAWFAAERFAALRTAQTDAHNNTAANRFATGLFEVLMERLATNTALQAEAPASAEALAEIARRRAAVQADMIPALPILAEAQFPGKTALMAELNATLSRAQAARQAADAALRQPRAARDPALMTSYVPTITASVNAATAVWFAAAHSVASHDPVLTRLAVINELGWRMRDIAGTERGNIASAIAAGQPLSAERISANAAVRARVDVLWAMLGNLAQSEGGDVHPAIRSAMQAAQSAYFTDFRTLADQMAAAGATGGAYPMDAQRFINLTTPQLGSLLGVKHAGATMGEAHSAEVIAAARSTLIGAGLLLALALVTAFGAGFFILRRVTGPLSALAQTTDQLAQGDLSAEIPGAGRSDEIGALARGLTTLRDGTRRGRDLEAQAAEDQKQAAELRRAETTRYADEFSQLMSGIMSSLDTSSERIRGAAGQMSTLVDETRSTASQTAEGSAESSRNLGTVASATEELSASVSEITRQVEEATRVSSDAVAQAQATGETVQSLSGAASEIGEVVQLISRIAQQTNLLALNATIEAARAGDAGKGFAVVASEVKQLAAQTAKATEQIAEQVAAIQNATGEAVTAVQGVGMAIDQVNEVAAAIAAAVEQQGAATREIASQVAAVAGQTVGASSAMQDVSKAAADSSEMSRSVLQAAEEVQGVSTHMRAEVMQFVSRMRDTAPAQGRVA